ncbi:MAG: hydrogenase maturation protease [Paracoccaceae bacterium]
MPEFPKAREQTDKIAPAVLIAGVGNVLLGDDGFGVEVANRLAARPELPEWVKVIETGIGGMSLIQELMQGFEALIIVDAYARGGEPGQIYFLEPILPDLSGLAPSQLRDYFADTHYATPIRALSLLAQVAKQPKILRILGCEPADLDEMKIGLSNEVENAVEIAVGLLVKMLAEYKEKGLGSVSGQDIVQQIQQWSPNVKRKKSLK